MSFLANYIVSQDIMPKMLSRSTIYFVAFLLIVVTPSGASPHATKSSSEEFGCNLNPRFSGGIGRVPPRGGDNGFSVKLEGLPESYHAEKTYTVTLRSTYPVTFRGFALTAVHSNTSTPAGSFNILSPWTVKAMDNCEHVITHSHSGKKSQVQLVWTSPRSGFGCVTVKASVIQKGTIWFRDDGELSLNICESVEEDESAQTEECCACGSAQYRLTFYGLWSPETHPKNYPTYSTHWSNIIGASHDNRYTVWDYGQYASDGVKKVAEWGWVNALEDEISGQGDRVLSIIKTRAQWPAYQPRNIREPPSSVFDVDPDRHLVSFVIMLGPSPDWNVGITKESMCSSECGWKATETFDLTPWDAGTDNGVSYLSANSITNPPEKIRALTSLDDPESPFYNPTGEPIPPVARVVLERLAISGDQCGPSPPSTAAQSGGREGHVSEPALTSCMYGDFSEWSPCGVTCGWGIKVRSKELKVKLVDSASCKQTVMEKEICKGLATCDDEDASTVCLYSDWTAWSDCTASCGESALRFRTRQLKWPSEPLNCQEPLKEMKFDCDTSPCSNISRPCKYGPWSDWMPCSSQCGMGKTLRKRFVMSGDNCESPSMEFSTCMASVDCSEPDGFDVPTGCTYSPWTGWMPCPAKCGVGETFRKRTLASSTPNVRCEEIQMERTKCMTSETCSESDQLNINLEAVCEYSDWSDWMPCSVSCNVGQTLRKRFLKGTSRGPACEDFEMESVKCFMPPCDVMARRNNGFQNGISASKSSCMYGPWTAWMPCSVSCGRGETLRKRFLVKSLDISRTCEGFEMETNRCSVPAACEEIANEENIGASVVSGVWGEWSHCSTTCGQGVRSRTWNGPGCHRGSDGNCESRQTEKCAAREKCPIDCLLSEWSTWSACGPCRSSTSRARSRSRSRKTTQSRTRTRISKPSHGGLRCGQRKERRRCICPGL